MADRRNRFAGIEERLREGNRIRLNAKRVRVDDAARQQHRVEIFRLGLIDLHIDRQAYAPVLEIPGPYALMFGRYDLGRGAGFVQSFAWLGEFDLLEAVGDQDGHIESFKWLFCHDLAPLRSWCSERRFAGAVAQAPALESKLSRLIASAGRHSASVVRRDPVPETDSLCIPSRRRRNTSSDRRR